MNNIFSLYVNVLYFLQTPSITPHNTQSVRPPYTCGSHKVHYLYYTGIFYVQGFISCEEIDCLKCDVFSLLHTWLCHNVAANSFRIHLSKPKEINLIIAKLSAFLTWHNPVQVRHILDAIVCHITVVFAQYLQDLRPQTVLNLRMQCQLVQGETQSTGRSIIAR